MARSSQNTKQQSVEPVLEVESSPVIMVDSNDDDNKSEVTFNSDFTEKVPPERNVKVVLGCSHTCTIGGVRYHFEKGKQYNVPMNVKTILRQAGLLMPL